MCKCLHTKPSSLFFCRTQEYNLKLEMSVIKNAWYHWKSRSFRSEVKVLILWQWLTYEESKILQCEFKVLFIHINKLTTSTNVVSKIFSLSWQKGQMVHFSSLRICSVLITVVKTLRPKVCFITSVFHFRACQQQIILWNYCGV